MWREMMQPRTPLRYRSPFLMPYPRQPCTPAYGAERGGVSVAARCKAWGLQGPELTAAACETACAPCPASSRLSAACSTLAVPNPGSAAWVCRPGTGLGLRASCSLRAHCRPWVASCARRRCLPRLPRKDAATSWAIIVSLGCPSARTAQRRALTPLQQTAARAAAGPCPARAERIQGAFTHPSTSSASRDPA